jgi:hypothetical protein
MSDPLREALNPGADCPPLELLAATHPDAAVESHLKTCAYCRSELALFHQFEKAEARPEEAADLAWVQAELTRRSPVKAPAFAERLREWSGLIFSPAWRGKLSFATAALLVLVAVGVYLPSRDGGRTPAQHEAPVWRSGRFAAISPLGDLDRAPNALRWEAVPGAASYHVRLVEVDGTEIWSADVSATTVDFPNNIAAKLLPGRAFQWSATAHDANRNEIAATDLQTFHILVTTR